MRTLLKSTLMPGSPMLLLIGLAAGAILLTIGRTRTWGRRWIVALGVTYWLMSTPMVADALAAALAGDARSVDEASVAGAQAIVVLDGGTRRYVRGDITLEIALEPTALRALEAARVYTLMPSPLVIVTGGSNASDGSSREGRALANALIRSGVPEDRILVDPHSTDTREHAVNVGRILRDRGIARFVLVTSATHMRRSLLAFRREGLEPVASPAAMHSDDFELPEWQRWVPNIHALWVSEQVCYDLIGLTYYWARGWV